MDMDRVSVTSSGIERWQLRRGDHIYAYRKSFAKIYSHHGIYESDKKVIHFTSNQAQSSTGFSGSGSSSSFIFCWECRQAMHGGGGVSCCLDCFLEGDNLCLFAYSVPFWFYNLGNVANVGLLANRARLTCHMADADPPETVLERANDLLDRKGFGSYDVGTNNCFDFAFYCKTGETGGTILPYMTGVALALPSLMEYAVNEEPVRENSTCMIL